MTFWYADVGVPQLVGKTRGVGEQVPQGDRPLRLARVGLPLLSQPSAP